MSTEVLLLITKYASRFRLQLLDLSFAAMKLNTQTIRCCLPTGKTDGITVQTDRIEDVLYNFGNEKGA